MLLILLAAPLFVGVLVLLYSRDPAGESGYPVCVFHHLTGLDCPGCGTLRALHQLLHGNVLAALRLNALSVCLLPVLALVVARNWLAAWRGRVARWPRPRWVPAGWRWGIVVLVIGFGILRNVPLWPFKLLAPH
ncbi:MAG TPA: DUF2752 domain-containing protein [Pirellulales bacterium]|nr:DUF2752 domain-containing protein [Pirellulales bacterium]